MFVYKPPDECYIPTFYLKKIQYAVDHLFLLILQTHSGDIFSLLQNEQ